MSDKGVILLGEPMALFMATIAGSLDGVTNYDVDIAGAEINVAIGMTRLGHRASYITKLGYDPFAKLIEKRLEDSSIDTSYIKYSQKRNTGFMLKNLVFEGNPEIAYFRKNSAASQLNEDDLKDIDFFNYDNLHVTGIMPAVSKSARQSIYSLVAIATNDITRGISYCERRGFVFEYETKAYAEDKLIAIYFKEQIAGWAFHLRSK